MGNKDLSEVISRSKYLKRVIEITGEAKGVVNWLNIFVIEITGETKEVT